ncbi:hypothetical protein PTHTG4_27740 [Parageobacillus thermoglucosidasius]|uniref:hypothetical protein n=1 Tax=Parageobacillus thermoglucosidasius TaxID=1426 RepID=UPI000F625CE5|nr:hypothetical protein [Parageobacillus thermoglucosidasius]GCD83710.1 hypothetical protein PTHTG4_27740 [Parageobacillus thermoglucosidasius]
MDYYKLMEQDFNKYKKLGFLLTNDTAYSELVFNLFKRIYFINITNTKAEFRGRFSNDFYKISFSCLVEALLLFSQNYIRASSLVLRSAIENYLKHQLQINNAKINDRVYLENKIKFDEVINSKNYKDNEKLSLIKFNEKLLTLYKRLSGFSHSLTIESKNLQIDFISDFNNLLDNNIRILYNHFRSTLDYFIMLNIHTLKESLTYWSRDDLNNFFRIVMGNKRIKRLIRIIKDNEDLRFDEI